MTKGGTREGDAGTESADRKELQQPGKEVMRVWMDTVVRVDRRNAEDVVQEESEAVVPPNSSSL